jgi:hypothetical protein
VEALKTRAVTPKRRREGSYDNSSAQPRREAEHVRLEGLVTQPAVSEEEFRWVQQRRLHNQRFAAKNTSLQGYLLKSRIRCTRCGRVYTGMTRNGRSSYYYRRGRTKQHWGAERCTAASFQTESLERAVFDTVTQILQAPEVYLEEVQRGG